MASGVILLMVQVDDAPGELLGEVMKTLSALGAKNIQLLSSLAKKGRPGYVLLIDILADHEREVAAILAGDLGVWGYRVLHSDHKHFNIERHDTTIEINSQAGVRAFPMRIKRILDGTTFMRVKAEHDDLSAICAALASDGKRVSLSVLKAKIESTIGASVPAPRTPITLD